MLINFCHPCLNPLLSCDTVCCDGYEITNLIAVDSSQQKGLLADYFMKPPMTVTVTLICDVNLSHIVIYPRVGAQKSVGFEIYASQEVNSSSINEEQLIGVGYIRNSEDCIVFSKRRKIDSALNDGNIPFSQHLFFSRVHTLISKVRVVSIKITRTLRSSVPSLKKIEIWGQPSSSCDQSSKRRVQKLWLDSTQDVFEEEPCILDQNVEETEIPINESELVIPEEFLDVITYNILAMPMLLPSGKVVDQSTLEKCAIVDAQSGRIPSDPFTGEIFTDERRPVFFSALKLRLDKFLNDNAHHEVLRNTSRTVGKRKLGDCNTNSKKVCNKFVRNNNSSANPCDHQSTSSATGSCCGSLKVLNSHDSSQKSNSSTTNANANGTPEKTTSKNKNNTSGVEIICIDETEAQEVIDVSDDSNASDQTGTHQPVNELYTSTSHIVDDILQKTLAGLPSFTRPSSARASMQKQCAFVKLILVGAIWGGTNPLIKIGSKGLEKFSKKSGKIEKSLLEFKFLLLNWKYMLPFLINQSGSVLYYLTLQKTDLSLAVPITNSVAFMSTAFTGWLIGEEAPNGRTFLGMLFILAGISCYILDQILKYP